MLVGGRRGVRACTYRRCMQLVGELSLFVEAEDDTCSFSVCMMLHIPLIHLRYLRNRPIGIYLTLVCY